MIIREKNLKKNLLNKYKEQKDKKDFYFFDESRFGTH